MSKRNPRVLVRLTCGHLQYWTRNSARLSEMRTCSKCFDVVGVDAWWDREWRADCLSCRWAVTTGRSEIDAQRAARNHRHIAVARYALVEPLLREPLPDTEIDATLDLRFEVEGDPPPFC